MSTSSILTEIRKKWFILGIVTTIALARLTPYIGAKNGPLRPEITVKYLAVSLIFFNSGLSLKTEDLTKAFGQVGVHVFIQCYTLIFVPIIVTAFVKLLTVVDVIQEEILTGLQVVGCMPPPVSSAVILTKAVGGNEAVAIFNSAMGSFLGIIVTPILLLAFVGTSTAIPFFVIFWQLSLTVIMPLLLGQVFRYFMKEYLQWLSLPYGTISSCILLLIIYTTFCETFIKSDSGFLLSSLIAISAIVITTQCFLLSLAFTLSRMLSLYSKHDVIAILFCSTHKSLTLGIPILNIVFPDSKTFGLLSLPLLVYHPTQILLGSLLVPYLQAWVTTNSEKKPEVESCTNSV